MVNRNAPVHFLGQPQPPLYSTAQPRSLSTPQPNHSCLSTSQPNHGHCSLSDPTTVTPILFPTQPQPTCSLSSPPQPLLHSTTQTWPPCPLPNHDQVYTSQLVRLQPHLPRSFHSLPQAEVQQDDDQHEAGCELPAGRAQVIDATALMEVQHTTPGGRECMFLLGDLLIKLLRGHCTCWCAP